MGVPRGNREASARLLLCSEHLAQRFGGQRGGDEVTVPLQTVLLPLKA